MRRAPSAERARQRRAVRLVAVASIVQPSGTNTLNSAKTDGADLQSSSSLNVKGLSGILAAILELAK